MVALNVNIPFGITQSSLSINVHIVIYSSSSPAAFWLTNLLLTVICAMPLFYHPSFQLSIIHVPDFLFEQNIYPFVV